MTNQNVIRGPQISALLLFQRLAPTCAQALSHQLHRAGVGNSHDFLDALCTGLRTFARARGLCLSTEFANAWPEALQALASARNEAEWKDFLVQSSAAPKATPHQVVRGAGQVHKVLEAAAEEARMSPRVATALGTWILVASVVAHSGPRDADLSLEDLATCF